MIFSKMLINLEKRKLKVIKLNKVKLVITLKTEKKNFFQKKYVRSKIAK